MNLTTLHNIRCEEFQITWIVDTHKMYVEDFNLIHFTEIQLWFDFHENLN
jgi:hypothetical protein